MKPNKFPWKKALIGTLVILVVAVLTLSLFYSTAMNGENEYGWVYILVWGLIFGLILLVYWIHLILDNHRKNKP